MKKNLKIFDNRKCKLGEGCIWHPEREQLFWVDINSKLLLSKKKNTLFTWKFDEFVSALGWVNYDTLIIASESSLFTFNLSTEKKSPLVNLEKEDISTRSNDGRADPWGGFWISTMGKNAEKNLGKIYRYYQNKLKLVFKNLSIPNAICFSKNKKYLFYTDTPTKCIYRQELDASGWPIGRSELFINMIEKNLLPDGAIVCKEGNIWNAQYGASQISCYNSNGEETRVIKLPAEYPTCLSFGGINFDTLFITTSNLKNSKNNVDGTLLSLKLNARGTPENKVIIK